MMQHAPPPARLAPACLPHVDFLGVRLHRLTMDQAIAHICAAIRSGARLSEVSLNVAKLVSLRRDPVLKADVAAADLVLADGMGVVLGARLLRLAIPERVAGVDLMDRMLEACAREGWRPYFLGARPDVLARAVQAAQARHPALAFAGAQHGYYAREAEPAVVAAVAASGATCLFVGMPSPRKEHFLARHGSNLPTAFVMGVGGGLDILAGHTARAPALWQRSGFEWLYRVIQEPRRMWRRYLTTNTRFALLLAGTLARQYFDDIRRLGGRLGDIRRLGLRPVPSATHPGGVAGAARPGGVRCRAIGPDDLARVEALLHEGFPQRRKGWFRAALAALAARAPPPGVPQFGYALEAGGEIVGVLLVIGFDDRADGKSRLRRNPACWYVRPGYRVFASALIDRLGKGAAATDMNISPAARTWATLLAQGFTRFNSDLFIGLPLLAGPHARGRALACDAALAAGWPVAPAALAILRDHQGYGCICLVCRDDAGTALFILRRRRFRGLPVACAQIIYCAEPGDIARFAHAIGRHLLRRGLLLMSIAADARTQGVPGWHFAGRAPMYFRGPCRPPAGDLRYTEAALFGF